jgi:zinc transport system ATP-binding protein
MNLAKSPKIDTQNQESILKVNSVSFGFDNLPLIFENVSFEVKQKEFIALIGSNGSGKTTLIKLILGLLRPNSGNISLFGKSLAIQSKYPSKNFWSQIGYIPQTPSQPKDFPITVKELLEISLLHDDKSLISESLHKLNIESLQNRQLSELSGGQRQKVYIARAILNNPKLIFLDEPTTGIDQLSESFFYKLIDDLKSEFGTAVVMISHDIGGISNKVDRIFCLDRTLEIIDNPKEYPHSHHIHVLSHNHHVH